MAENIMSGCVWMSDLKNNFKLGDKPGVRTKYFNHDWQPAEFKVPLAPDDVYANMRRAGLGFALKRHELPEAAAVWDVKRFKTLGEVFYAGGFLVVRGKLSEVLSRFDLGEGGLIPFPVYQADLETLYPGTFFLLNFGCIKDTLLPEQCENARKFMVRKATGVQVWHINDSTPDAKVVLSPKALEGPDLWFEEAAHNKIFMSNALAEALIEIGMGEVFRLTRCAIA
jgi:hypothetical protein